MRVERCPVCLGPELEGFFEIRRVPVNCNTLQPTLTAALEVPRGDIRLALCHSCGMITNVAFEPELLSYTEAYENPLDASPRFREYADHLVRRLVRRHDIRGKGVLEIGCGNGDFLRSICAEGRNRGIGIDAGHREDEARDSQRDVRFIKEDYSRRHTDLPADLICCRQVLEHVQRPREFLSVVRDACAKNRNCVVFFEVPDVLYTLDGLGIWDIIYEHCSYFSAPSLERLFLETGFRPTDIYSEYGGQFLCLEASTSPAGDSRPGEEHARIEEIVERAVTFASAFRRKIEHFSTLLEDAAKQGRSVVVWGAGSKGVSFVNYTRGAEAVRCLVDINPSKRGHFVAGTGHRIVGPEELRSQAVDAVLVMNPLYVDEVRNALSRLGLQASVGTV